MDKNKELVSLVKELESEYLSGKTTVSKYVDYSIYEDLQKIDAYSNSKHTSGSEDALGREKPFFNIVTSATNIWFRATDIDRKNIRLRTKKAKHWVATFIGNIFLQNWMRKENFGSFLNKWGYQLAKYGSSVLKFVESDGELHRMVVDWNKLIVDPVDFYSNPVIEILELTPAQLRKNDMYDKEAVKNLLDSVSARELLDGTNKDNRSHYIKLYEIHGELPLSFITGREAEKDKYVQQMHVVSYVSNGKTDDQFTLYSGREDKSPYILTSLIEEDGKTLSTGAVKSLFEAQWMVNHTAKQIKDQLDLASQMLYQTSDSNFVGQNALKAAQIGQILIHAPNQPLTVVAHRPIVEPLYAMQDRWKVLGNEQVGISEAMQGQVKSGTAWRQTEALLAESHSLFDIMTQNKGLHIEDIMRKYVIPFMKKSLNNSEEIGAMLEAYDIKKIDKLYVKSEAVKAVKRDVIETLKKGELPVSMDTATTEQQIQEQLNELGGQRFFKPSEIETKTWKDIFKGFEWEVEVDVVGEDTDAKAEMATLVTLYQNLLQKGDTETASKVLSKILELTGAFSPVEMTEVTAPTQPAPTQAPTMDKMVETP